SGYTWVSRQIRPAETLDAFEGVPAPGLTSGTVTYRARVAIRANPRATAVFRSGSTVVGRLSAPAVSNSIYDPVARTVEAGFTGTASGGADLDLVMGVETSGSGTIEPQAALDWVRAFYNQALRAQGGYLRFATPAGQAGHQEFVLSGFAQAPTVWDVTDGNAVRKLEARAEGASYVVQVAVSSPDLPREIVAFTEEAEQGVAGAERVGNQNLHGIQSYPDFVIVVPDTFRTYAEDLATMRRSDGLEVEVVGVEQIYNEFSGGLPDMRAVRDYFKFLYDRAPDDAHLLRYALLFGDGDYNFRHLGAQNGAVLTNWIFPYETETSFDEDLSFTSDDYFGLLDDGEGLWTYNGPLAVSQERVDIGIGRFPVQTVTDAQNAVAKLKHYESPASLGAWRTRYVFAADDALNGLAGTIDENDLHTQNADVVAEALHARSPEINIRKIYAISYDRVYTGGEWRIPVAKADILSALEEGTIAFNYSGHGSPESLAQEKLFTREDVSALDNLDRLPIFITATCSFGRWDMEEKQSTAEDLFNSTSGGAIALFTTVRTVFTAGSPFSLNVGLNRQLNIELFQRDESGLPRRLGDALRATKNTPVGLEGNNRKFNLLGDPTMRVGVPSGKAAIATVNGISVDTMAAPLRALDHITVTGEVRAPSGQVNDGFNGTVQLTVYDAARRVPVAQQQYLSNPYYRVQEDLIWRGEVTAAAGRYQAEFVVPKDISYANEPGRIAVYAQGNGMSQAIGYTDNVQVGGSVEPPKDHEGPRLHLFLNDTTFVSGGLTQPRPDLIVKLFDESGVNTVGAGVGHELQLVLDGQDASAVNLSSRYRSEGDSYQKGSIEYPLQEYLAGQGEEKLSPGPHSLKVKAWDVLNNSTSGTLDFYVSSGEELALRNVFNYPNPMVDATRFVFEHNQPGGTPADVQVRIYTLSGRPVRTIDSDEALPGGVLPGGPVQIPWDGRDDDLDRLATGIYLYKLRVRIETPDGERQVAEQIEKIALIR
ncbi:MAG TPA: type IX secretion system sortase PorU, partial [Rhodothermales bacterium]|nr:type IX secretion system sortase PorU [Rhodothermales bacterium]